MWSIRSTLKYLTLFLPYIVFSDKLSPLKTPQSDASLYGFEFSFTKRYIYKEILLEQLKTRTYQFDAIYTQIV